MATSSAAAGSPAPSLQGIPEREHPACCLCSRLPGWDVSHQVKVGTCRRALEIPSP